MLSHPFSQISYHELPPEILPGFKITRIHSSGKNCHLIHAGELALLINCVEGVTPQALKQAGLPVPGEIWHTEVSSQLAAEGDHFAGAVIQVPAGFQEVATDSEAYRSLLNTTWEHPEDWPRTLGRGPIGIGGSTLLHPPPASLPPPQTFEPGQMLTWNDLSFRVLDAGVRWFHSVAFWHESGPSGLLFVGDLVTGEGKLPDAFGFEASYGGIAWVDVATTVRSVAQLDPAHLLPATGETLPRPAAALVQLATQIDEFLKPTPAQQFTPPFTPEKLGRYFHHGNSVYQISNFGNVILFIDKQGRGLLIDPGPCDYENPNRKEDFQADLDLFEAEAGLKKIELVLVTHMHGDHYDLWPEVQNRYPACKLGAWSPLADLIENPSDFPYACLLPWYAAGWECCPVDERVEIGTPFLWNAVEIHTTHLPGHCFVHAGYWIEWHGRRILISGDSIQTSGAPDNLQCILSNHSIPGTDEGHAWAYHNALEIDADLNLGGHSSFFTHCREVYAASLLRIESQTTALVSLFDALRPEEIFLRPSLRPAAERVRKSIKPSMQQEVTPV